MPLYVGVYTIENGMNALAGVISLGEQGLNTEPTPGNENLLKKMLREPIQDPNTKQMVTSRTNPEAWMKALNFHFKSAYLRASRASLVKPGMQTPGSQQPVIQPGQTPPARSGEKPPQSPQPRPPAQTTEPPPTASEPG